MPVPSETTPVSTPDGQMNLFVAKPEGAGPHPGLVVIQEAFGVNDHIKDVTQRFAGQGYFAVAPDLFHRFEQRTVPYTDMQTAIGSIMKLNDDMVMNDVNAAIGYVKSQAGVGTIGIIGYCFGGRTAYLAATRSKDVACAVGYYGGGIADPRNPNAPVTRSADISVPLLLFFGAQDQLIPQDQVQKIEETLSGLGKEHQIKVYPHAGHGFNCDARGSYNKEAADDASKIALEFFAKNLR
ncbi:MAG TPA: dienelactone hydrolase family protein [Chloroflexota bacterium]|nr:dienelactone hydrolase family protein [Chloroflexota bacterium]